MAEFAKDLFDFVTRAALPPAVPTYLLAFSPPVTEVSEVALIGEKEDFITRALTDANVTEFTLVLNARALALEVYRQC